MIVTGKLEKSSNVRFEGEEIRKGEIALEVGIDITPAAIGFMAEPGIVTRVLLRICQTCDP